MSNKYYTKKQQRDDQIYYVLNSIKYYAQKILEAIILYIGLWLLAFFMSL